MDSALSVRDLSLNIGGAKILDGITLEVAHNETLGIIGPNGAGKTSFFNLLSGLREATTGTIKLGETDITNFKPYQRAQAGIARTFQTSSIFSTHVCKKFSNLLLFLGTCIQGSIWCFRCNSLHR